MPANLESKNTVILLCPGDENDENDENGESTKLSF
jgi:hypothetical protein